MEITFSERKKESPKVNVVHNKYDTLFVTGKYKW